MTTPEGLSEKLHHALVHMSSAQSGGARVVPAQLPADVDLFTGREQELAELDRLLAGTLDKAGAVGKRSTAVGISVVCGTAGVGKTALAVRWVPEPR
ncbi:MAG: hypothetical protein ACRDSL_06260 [Pseudonocardiaceae bacterium]